MFFREGEEFPVILSANTVFGLTTKVIIFCLPIPILIIIPVAIAIVVNVAMRAIQSG
jgi:hypothetical protein